MSKVDELEQEIIRLESERILLLDQEYISSGNLRKSLDDLLSMLHTNGYGEKIPLTMEEKVAAIIKGARRAKDNETDLYWGKRGNGC